MNLGMKARVLIVEDVAELSALVALYLSKEGLETRQAETAEAALALIPDWAPDLIILDINLPGMDGFEFLHEFRKGGRCPVLIVSARDADEDIIAGLGYGADEFVTKPFSPRVSHRPGPGPYPPRPGRCPGPGPADRGAVRPLRPGHRGLHPHDGWPARPPVRQGIRGPGLPGRESGPPLSPQAVYASVWKNAYGDLTAVAVYVQRLRKKLRKIPADPRYLETVHGMGYRFNPSESPGARE
ncbi:MAG: response regulator transcription factor [Rhodopseudomonas palustris]|nr:response regulator transcription factor [Rhodopseudomonas palustris]